MVKCESWKSTIWIVFPFLISHLQKNQRSEGHDFFCGGFEKSCLEQFHKELFKIFLNIFITKEVLNNFFKIFKQ